MNDCLNLNGGARRFKVKQLDWSRRAHKEDLVQRLRRSRSKLCDLREWAAAGLSEVEVGHGGEEEALRARRIIHEKIGLGVKCFSDADLCVS